MRCDLAGILDYLPLWSWAVALHPKVFWLMLHVQSFERAYYLEHQDGCQRSLFFCSFIRQVSGLSMIFHQVSLLRALFLDSVS